MFVQDVKRRSGGVAFDVEHGFDVLCAGIVFTLRSLLEINHLANSLDVVQVIRPYVHHSLSLVKKLCPVVGSPQAIRYAVCLPHMRFLFVGPDILPAASFRFRLATDTRAVRLTVPTIWVRRGLEPPSQLSTTTVDYLPLKRHAPCLAHT